jgi:hypothetical protein
MINALNLSTLALGVLPDVRAGCIAYLSTDEPICDISSKPSGSSSGSQRAPVRTHYVLTSLDMGSMAFETRTGAKCEEGQWRQEALSGEWITE